MFWNSPSVGINSRYKLDYSCLSFKREKIGGHSPTFYCGKNIRKIIFLRELIIIVFVNIGQIIEYDIYFLL